MRRPHWFGEDMESIDTTLAEILSLLPVFERHGLGRNRFRDLIVRQDAPEQEPLPVGVVSKTYALVQHGDAVRSVIGELKTLGVDPSRVGANLLISEYGTRIALRATLPDAFDLTPEDGHRMALTFECFNSVDGSVPLFAAVGWFRFVCANGMVVGTTSAKVRQRHTPSLRIADGSSVLAEGIRSAVKDREAFQEWQGIPVSPPQLEDWVGGYVAVAWGLLAAARVHHIATTGFDGTPKRRARNWQPHTWPVVRTTRVPGTPAPCADAYQVAQVLAWMASQRADVAQRLEWRAEIPDLVTRLISEAA